MKIVIVGAGSAGIFAAFELLKNPQMDITLIEKSSLIGGSGLQSDGKLNFAYKDVGTQDLTRFVSEQEAEKIIKYLEKYFESKGICAVSPAEKIINKLSTECSIYGMEYHPTRQAHIGTDNLSNIMSKIYEYLLCSRVRILLHTEIFNIHNNTLLTQHGTEIPFDYLILALGRTGSLTFKPIYDSLGIKCSYNPIDIGIRVEVPAASTYKLVEEYGIWESKISMNTSKNEKVRTFCHCPYGFVKLEHYGKFYDRNIYGVNGNSKLLERSPNTNFALLNTVHLTKPFEDTTLLGQNTVWMTNLLGGGYPIAQRYKDFLEERRSTPEKISEMKMKPTLSNRSYVAGDINFAYSAKIVQNLKEGMKKISHIIPMPVENTLLYAPEVKFYARCVNFKEGFKTHIENIYVVGDGSGISRGIIGAAATGIIAARQIVGNI